MAIIKCCSGCVAPKRYPGCHDHCPEYAAERAEYAKHKTKEDKRRKVKSDIYKQRSINVAKAMRRHRR